MDWGLNRRLVGRGYRRSFSDHAVGQGSGLALAAVGILCGLAAISWPALPPVRNMPGPLAPVSRVGNAVAVPPPGVPVEAFSPEPLLRVGIRPRVSRVSIRADSGVVVIPFEAQGAARSQGYTVPRATFLPASIPPTRDRAQNGPIAKEARPRGRTSASRLRFLEAGVEVQGATLVPVAKGETLWTDDTPYRGYLEVRAGEGALTVVNVLSVEDYVRGVVPNELSPLASPGLEAMKAQAVAARTYALRHRGEYASDGYDLCATPACQVYRGRSTEHPLTDRAVEETAGVVVRHGGAPINALYTSTCGGHTEDGENVFEGHRAEPYLRGVVCVPERSARPAVRTTAAPESFGDREGLSRNAALLVALDVLEPRLYSAAALKAAATIAELKTWTARLVSALNRQGCSSEVDGVLTRRASYFEYLVGSLCWEELGRELLLSGDANSLLRPKDSKDLLDVGERAAAALLIHEGILSPLPGNTLRPAFVLTRSQAIQLLTRTLEKVGSPRLVVAEFQGSAGGRLAVSLSDGGGDRSYPLDASLRLFRDVEGVRAATGELGLAAGDRVRFVLRDGRVAFLEGRQSSPRSTPDPDPRDDRWEVSMTPAEVGRAVARYGTIADVRDLQPRRVGVSGRVVELAVLGGRGQEELVLRGLKVRWGLGLRENLFVIDREIDAAGSVERFVFKGRGWGHGVGLCQLGALAMARSGSSFEEILTHYYTGVTLSRMY